MTDEQYPLVKAAGLKIVNKTWQAHYGVGSATFCGDYVSADDLEAFFAAAPVVEVIENCKIQGKQFYRTKDLNDAEGDGFSARLILIEPIRTETAEDLLREFVAIRTDNLPTGNRLELLAEKAKRLLERGQG